MVRISLRVYCVGLWLWSALNEYRMANHPRSFDQSTMMMRMTRMAIIPADRNFCWYILEESDVTRSPWGERLT
jgi:hypothetical protein